MKADLTRNTFNSFNHYARVIMQQGRVQIDADWNEQASILLHYLQTLAADLIGPAGGPVDDLGFRTLALPANANNQAITTDFQIGLGRYYVDGILCEAESSPIDFTTVPETAAGNAASANMITVSSWSVDGTEFANGQYVLLYDNDPPDQDPAFQPTVATITDAQMAKSQLTLQLPAGFSFGTPANPRLERVITYLTQPDYPAPPALPGTGSFQLYLDVWERHLTYVQADAMREVALGGADTATRSKIVWQVKALTSQAFGQANQAPRVTAQELTLLLQPPTGGMLRARAKQSSPQSNPCIISPNAMYQGPENQLYRVEIHRPGAAWDGTDVNAGSPAATFKWSRENGSVVFPIVKGGATNVVMLESLGRDDRFGLATGDWVEVQDDRSTLLNTPGTLLQVQSLDQASATVTLAGTPAAGVGGTASLHPLVRRWDQKLGDPAEAGLTLGSDGAALIQEGVWLALEAGVEIFFEPLAAGQANTYRSADYWLISARTATGDVEWPKLTDPSGNPVLDSNGNTIPLSKAPDGVIHHYAPLATVNLVAGQEFSAESDLNIFHPLAAMPT